jgi:hypothetical protein
MRDKIPFLNVTGIPDSIETRAKIIFGIVTGIAVRKTKKFQ